MNLQEYFNKELYQTLSDYGYYCVLPVLFVICSIFILRHLAITKSKLPPGPIGLPLLGYLPFLGNEPFKTLDALSKKYGNVYSLYLGRTYVVILGDFQAVKETFSKTTATDRPPGLFDFLPDGSGFSAANGAEWVEQRRFVVKCMKDIGLGRSIWSRLVEEEVSDFLKAMEEKKGQPLDIEQLVACGMSSNIGSLVFGKRLPQGPERDTLHYAVNTLMSFFSQAGLWNYYPWLCNMLVKLKITRCYKSYCLLSAFNKIIRRQIDSHRETQSGLKHDDFISMYVDEMQRKEAEGNETTFNERNLIGNTQTLYVAGSDTTGGSLIWLFLAMVAYPDTQEKVHRELDSVLGKEERAAWEDRAKFPYIYATIMESQRWKTIVPLNTSHLATEDIKICGYDIPKGSTIIANNWAINNDTRYWSEPEKFIPDRFLQNNGKEVVLKPESFVPFSYGKRKCPGETVALMEIFLYFTAMMQKFEVKMPNRVQPNLDGVPGLTYQPVSQELCFVPRKNL